MRKITRPKTIANKIVEFMLEKKAYDILVIDVKHLTSLTDIFVICTSDSSPQSKAIANHIKDELIKYNLKPSNIEGYEQMKWILIDYNGGTYMSQNISIDFHLFTFFAVPVVLHFRPEIYQNTRKIADFHEKCAAKGQLVGRITTSKHRSSCKFSAKKIFF